MTPMLGTLIFAAALTNAPANEARTLRLNAGQVLAVAEQAAKQGDLATAENAYQALAHDPDPEVRAEAMFRHGLMLAQNGQLKGAALLFRQLLDEKPDATRVRLELAQALDRMGDKEGAWREMRAVQASGLPPEVARMVDRYSEALRAARPFGASFQIALAPDSNINTSTRSDTLGTVFGDFEIDKDSKAKSGVGLAISGQAYRRLPLGGENAILGRISGTGNLYEQSDFDDVALDLAVGPELQLGKNRLNIELAGTQRWYGMTPYVRSARLSASLIRPVGRTTQVQLMGSAGVADYRLNDLQDGKTFYGRIKLEHSLSGTTGIGLNLSAGRTAAKDAAYSTKDWRVGLIAWRDVGRATFTAEAEYGRLRADDRLAILPEARSDRYSRLTLGATFRQLTFAGFAPVTRFVIERNRSTVEFYDYSRKRTEVGISRAF
jgi:tetratricopeptide (TPR) repeat protein